MTFIYAIQINWTEINHLQWSICIMRTTTHEHFGLLKLNLIILDSSHVISVVDWLKSYNYEQNRTDREPAETEVASSLFYGKKKKRKHKLLIWSHINQMIYCTKGKISELSSQDINQDMCTNTHTLYIIHIKDGHSHLFSKIKSI